MHYSSVFSVPSVLSSVEALVYPVLMHLIVPVRLHCPCNIWPAVTSGPHLRAPCDFSTHKEPCNITHVACSISTSQGPLLTHRPFIDGHPCQSLRLSLLCLCFSLSLARAHALFCSLSGNLARSLAALLLSVAESNTSRRMLADEEAPNQ